MANNIRHQNRPNSPRQGKISMRTVLGLTGVLLIAGGAAYATVEGKLPDWLSAKKNRTDLVTAPVKRGELRLTVVATGNLDSARNVTLHSNVKGSAKIIFIVPEGTQAYEGMTLVKLDASVYQDQLDEQQIALTQAEAMRDQAKDALDIQETVNESEIAAAKLQVTLAELDLKKYIEGDFEVLRTAAESKITLAKETLTSAIDTYAFSKRQSKKGYVNQNDLEQKRISVKTAELKLKEAELELNVLLKYQKTRELAEKEANAIEFKRELARTEQKAASAISQAKADLASREMTATVERTKLEKLQEQISQCEIVAPQAGQVIYASEDSRRSSQERVIEEGASVDERQALIKLPDMSQMQVDTRIHESKIGFVREGMPAIVKVSRKSDSVYRGVVDTVASVPNSSNWRQPDLREYAAVIRIVGDEGEIKKLKPGLTAAVEVISEILDDVLKIPVQSVIARNQKYFVFVNASGGPEIRQLYLGATNDIETEVREIEQSDPAAKFPIGVKEGEHVILAPRTTLPDLFTILENAEPEKQVNSKTVGEGDRSPGEKRRGPRGEGDSDRGEPGAGPQPRGRDKGQQASKQDGDQSQQTPASGGNSKLAEFFNRLDTNSDGNITKEEAKEGPMAANFDSIDSNSDGNIDKSEFEIAAAAFAKSGGSGDGGGGGSQ